MEIIRKNPKLGNYVHFVHGGRGANFAGVEQIDTGEITEDGAPIYADGGPLYSVDWQEGWGEPVTEEGLADWQEPEPEPSPVTDVEMGAGKMARRRLVREELIFSPTSGLFGTCYAWLQRPCAVPGEEAPQSLSPSAALAAGQGLCSTYGNQLRSWVDWATADFYTSMSSPDPTRPWLEWTPAGESKSIREAILDRVYLATFGTPRP